MGQCSVKQEQQPKKYRRKEPRKRSFAGRSIPSDNSHNTPVDNLSIERHGSTLTRKGGKGTLKRKLRIDEVDTQTMRLLLLGCRRSGKTTIFRQVGRGEGKEIKDKFGLRGQLLKSLMADICNAVKVGESLGFEIEHPSLLKLIKHEIGRISEKQEIQSVYSWPKKVADAFVELLQDVQLQKVFKEYRHLTEVSDNFDYFMQKLTKSPKYPIFGGPSWIPSSDECLRCYFPSTEKNSLKFVNDEVNYEIVDLGMTRMKKVNKISQSFQGLIFVASMGDYNQQLLENKEVNRLTDTIETWKKVVNAEDNKNLWFFLILNKKDILKNKFYDQEIPVKVDFKVNVKPPAPFEDDEDCMLIMKWFENIFISTANEEVRSRIRPYFICALELETVTTTMDYCASMLKHQLARM